MSFRSSNKVDTENEILKAAVQAKEILIKKNEKKIKELESKVNSLENFKSELTRRLNVENNNTKEMSEIMSNYKSLVSKIISDRESIINDKKEAEVCAASLEEAFNELKEKYEQAKLVIVGLEQNQEVLQNQIDVYKNVLSKVENRYKEFKKYAIEKLNEANGHLEKKDFEHSSQVTQLKEQLKDYQNKIEKFEKQLKQNKLNENINDQKETSRSKTSNKT